MGLGAVGGGNHGLEQFHAACGGPLVKETGDLCIEYYRNTVVSNHAVGFVSSEFPHGQFAARLVLEKHGIYPVFGNLGLDDGHERVQGTVSVPERKDGIDRFVGGADAVVHGTVASIHVAPQIGRCVAVIEGSIEVALFGAGATFYLDLAKCLLPALVRC